MKKHLILGSGYTGHYLSKLLKHKEERVTETSRSKPDYIRLDLTDPETWPSHSLEIDLCFWLAPMAVPELTLSFIPQCKMHFKKIIVLSSTGFFKSSRPDETITHESALDLSNPRVQSEEILMRETEAMIVHAAGIYGPGRSPIDWLRSRRVSRSAKYLNAIHVEDLANLLYVSSKKFIPNSRWLASDNDPHRWMDLYDQWKSEFNLENLPLDTSSQDSKRVDSTETIKAFGWKPKYKNVLEGVRLGMKSNAALS